MPERDVNIKTVEAIEALHQQGLSRIGDLLDGNHFDDARQVVDILAKVGII